MAAALTLSYQPFRSLEERELPEKLSPTSFLAGRDAEGHELPFKRGNVFDDARERDPVELEGRGDVGQVRLVASGLQDAVRPWRCGPGLAGRVQNADAKHPEGKVLAHDDDVRLMRLLPAKLGGRVPCLPFG